MRVSPRDWGRNILPSGNIFHPEGLVFSWRAPLILGPVLCNLVLMTELEGVSVRSLEAPLALWQLFFDRLLGFPLPQGGPPFDDHGSE
jgi:hypothetical protein